MTDAPVAATPTATPSSPSSASSGSAPLPSTSEVPIETSPTHIPNPMSSTGPDRPNPEGRQTHRPQSRREAIQEAFERASQPQQQPKKAAPKPAPKAAEAKPGHNNPPEPTEKEPPLNLRKRPADQEPQPRGDRGQFVARQKPAEAGSSGSMNEPASTGEAGTAGQTVRQLPPEAPFRDPVPRMSQKAVAEWHATPESVRADTWRMAKEFTSAYQRFKADHDEMNTIRRFQQMAKQHGTTLEKALTNYVAAEQKLRANPLAGLDAIVNNLNLKTSDGHKLTLRDIAYHVATQTPEQLQMIQHGNNQQAAAFQIGALHQEIAGLRQTVQQMHTQQQFTQNRAVVDSFAQTHPRLDELGDLIENEIKLGFDLETAYRRADLLRPSTTQAAQTRNTSAQTRTPDRSISGVPAGSVANGSAQHKGPPLGRREAVAHAIKHAGARI